MKTYNIDNGFGEEIACGMESYGEAESIAQRYLAAHRDDTVLIVSSEGDKWELTAADFAYATMGTFR